MENYTFACNVYFRLHFHVPRQILAIKACLVQQIFLINLDYLIIYLFNFFVLGMV